MIGHAYPLMEFTKVRLAYKVINKGPFQALQLPNHSLQKC